MNDLLKMKGSFDENGMINNQRKSTISHQNMSNSAAAAEKKNKLAGTTEQGLCQTFSLSVLLFLYYI